MFINAKDLKKDTLDYCDYVIIGSGAAGGVCAKMLAENGQDVVVVEEGPYIKTEEFSPNTWQAMKTLFRNSGNTVMAGRSIIPFIQGCCVGGTTTINAAICWRLPEDVFEQWKEFGVNKVIKYEKLTECFEEIEKELNIHSVNENVAGKNNLLAKKGFEKKRWEANFIKRNEINCKGSGLCLQGCPNNAKQSTNISYIPQAVNNGARVYYNCKAEKILTKQNVAVGIIAIFKNFHLKEIKLKIHSKKGVILAASTVQTPALLLKNKLCNYSGQVGENLQCHPGTAMFGFFEEEVKYWNGATQGFESIHFRKSKRFKIETLALAPELLAVRLPGIGAKLMDYLSNMKHYTSIAVQFRAYTKGKIKVMFNSPQLTFSLKNEDVNILKSGLKAVGEVLFAAGAKYIISGIYGLPEKLTSPEQLKLFDTIKMSPRSFVLAITHMMGAARMHNDKKLGVVKPNFETHEIEKLFITDSSIFPTNLGVNPQHTIMGLARYACNLMLDK